MTSSLNQTLTFFSAQQKAVEAGFAVLWSKEPVVLLSGFIHGSSDMINVAYYISGSC